MVLVQFGMGSGTDKCYFSRRKTVYHQPVAFNMAFRIPAVVTGKPMFPATVRQGFFPDDVCQNIIKIVKIPMLLFHKFCVFFESIGEIKVKHKLRAEHFFQFFFRPRFCFPGLKTVPFNLFFAAYNILGFLHGRQRNGVGLFPRLGIVTAGGGRFC